MPRQLARQCVDLSSQHFGNDTESMVTRLLRVLNANRASLTKSVAVSALLQLIAGVMPLLSKAIIDGVAVAHNQGPALLIVTAILLTAVFRCVLTWSRELFLLALQAESDTALQMQFVRKVLTVPLRLLQGRSAGDLLEAFFGITAWRTGAVDTTLAIVAEVFSMIALAATLAFLLPTLALAILVLVALSSVAGGWSVARQRSLQAQLIDVRARKADFFLNFVRGIASVKLASAEGTVIDRWSDGVFLESTLQRRVDWIDAVRDAAARFLVLLTTTAALLWLALGAASAGSVVAGTQLANAIMESASRVNQLRRDRAIAIMIGSKAQPMFEMPSRARRVQRVGNDIGVVLHDVWFRHSPDGPWIVRGFSAEVGPSTRLRIEGPSGWGKSTILRLIAGLDQPTRGVVRVGLWKPEELVGVVLYVPQFVTLHGGTVADNLRSFSGDAPWDRILAAAAHTGLQDMVDTLPMGFDTMLASGAGTLSGGQRQLVVMTAAAASNRPVVVLDEPMANLDYARQERILASRLFDGRALIYSSHTHSF